MSKYHEIMYDLFLKAFLVNNILDISKIEAGKMELYEADYHLWELLKECEDDMTSRLKNKPDVKFSIEADDDIPEHLYGDVLRLRQVITNLLSNAAKYTNNGSVVLKVSGEKKSGSNILMKFVVEDTGMGVPENRRNNLFSWFDDPDDVKDDVEIDLSICQRVAQKIGGILYMDENYHRRGSRFVLILPLR